MDWVALTKDPLWIELWASKEVNAKVESLRSNLLGGSETDPHAIGKMRGQLEGLGWLHRTVETMAKAQMEETFKPQAQTPAERVGFLRRLKVR